MQNKSKKLQGYIFYDFNKPGLPGWFSAIQQKVTCDFCGENFTPLELQLSLQYPKCDFIFSTE